MGNIQGPGQRHSAQMKQIAKAKREEELPSGVKVKWENASLKDKFLKFTKLGKLFGFSDSFCRSHKNDVNNFMLKHFANVSKFEGGLTQAKTQNILNDILSSTKEGKNLAGKLKQMKDVTIEDLNKITTSFNERAQMGKGEEAAVKHASEAFVEDLRKGEKRLYDMGITVDEALIHISTAIYEDNKLASKIGKLKPGEALSKEDLAGVFTQIKKELRADLTKEKMINDFKHDILSDGEVDPAKLSHKQVSDLVDNVLDANPEIKEEMNNLGADKTLSLSSSDKVFVEVSKKIDEIKQRQALADYIKRTLTAKGFEGVPGAKTYKVSDEQAKTIANTLIDSDSKLLAQIKEGKPLSPPEKTALANKAAEMMEKLETKPDSGIQRRNIDNVRKRVITHDLKNLGDTYNLGEKELAEILVKNEKANGKIMMGEDLNADDIFALGRDIEHAGRLKSGVMTIGDYFGFNPDLASSTLNFDPNNEQHLQAIRETIDDNPDLKTMILKGDKLSQQQLKMLGAAAGEAFLEMEE